MIWIGSIVNRQQEELEWLRFFYSEARYAMGPADSDIYSQIKKDYQEEGKILPEEYAEEDTED